MSRIYGLSSFKQYRINGKLLTIIGEYHKSQDKIIKCGSDKSVAELIRILNGNIALEYNPRLELNNIFLESWNLMEIIKLYKNKRKIIGFDIRSDFLEWFKIYDENDSVNITTVDYLLSKNSPVNLTKIPDFNTINYSKSNSDLLDLIKNILSNKLNLIKNIEIPKLYIYKEKNLTIKAIGQEQLILLLREFFAQLIDYYLLTQILINVNENWIILVGEQHSNALQFIFKKYLNNDPIFIGKKIGPECFDITGFIYK